jgi:hypothetical protein
MVGMRIFCMIDAVHKEYREQNKDDLVLTPAGYRPKRSVKQFS